MAVGNESVLRKDISHESRRIMSMPSCELEERLLTRWRQHRGPNEYCRQEAPNEPTWPRRYRINPARTQIRS
jgi:hypothetical protein